jgi:hypothetical protein
MFHFNSDFIFFLLYHVRFRVSIILRHIYDSEKGRKTVTDKKWTHIAGRPDGNTALLPAYA